MKVFLSCLFIFFISAVILSGAIFPPNLKWKSTSTDHFIIVFHQNEEKIVSELIPIAEKCFNDLSLFWNGEVPKDKIYILLTDHLDYSNAITNIFPYNSITIYLKAPAGEGFLGNYDNWLKIILYHELMHVFHLNHTKGFYKSLQNIFGRHPFLFPHLLEPHWSIEGLATFSETNWTSKGRGRASDVNMMFRIASIYNKLPTVDQTTGPLIKFPGALSSYLYGFSFINYLYNNYPSSNLYKLYNSYSSSIIPFSFSSHFKKIYNKDFSTLWNEWQYNLKQKYSIHYDKTQNTKILLDRGYYIYQPFPADNGKIIYYSVYDPNSFPKICKFSTYDSKEECFLDRYGGYYISNNEDYILFSQLEKFDTFFIYSDLYLYSKSTRHTMRLTNGLRARDADFAGNDIIFITDEIGSSNINLIPVRNLPCKKNHCHPKIIIKGTYGTQFAGVKWNASRQLAAASQWENNGIMSIIIFDKNGNIIHKIGNNHYRYISPFWSQDGNTLFFSSDINGIFNIFSFSLQTENICQITDEISGAFYPATSNSELFYIRYSYKGFQLASIHLNKELHSCNNTIINPINITSKNEAIVNFKINRYSPGPLLIPKYWSPMLFTKGNDIQIGFFTSANDFIFHSYTLSFSHGMRSNTPLYEFHYNYDRFYPTLGISIKKNINWQNDNESSTKKESEFFIYFPYRKIKLSTYGTLGISREIHIYKEQNISSKYDITWFNLTYSLSNAKKYAYSISPTDGAMLTIRYQHALNTKSTNGSLHKLELVAENYLPFFLRHHVLAIKAAYGYSWGESNFRSAYLLGGKEGDSDLLPLRGYKTNSILASKVFLSNIEYHFPIVNIEHGKGNLPLFIQRMHANIFIDYAKALTFDYQWENKKSAGIELSIDLTFAYSLNATIGIGYAKGLNDNGINQFYFLFRQYF